MTGSLWKIVELFFWIFCSCWYICRTKSHCRQVCIGFDELILRFLKILKVSQFYFSILPISKCWNESNSIFPRDYRLPYNQSQSRNMHLNFSASRESERANNQGLLASCTLKLHKAVQVNAWLHTNNDARCASYGTHTYTPGLTEPRGQEKPFSSQPPLLFCKSVNSISARCDRFYPIHYYLPSQIFRPSYDPAYIVA